MLAVTWVFQDKRLSEKSKCIDDVHVNHEVPN
jgi:hypothetical protein